MSQQSDAAYSDACDCGGCSTGMGECWNAQTPPAATDVLYDALLWISEYPNREQYPVGNAVDLAEYAREALNAYEEAEQSV